MSTFEPTAFVPSSLKAQMLSSEVTEIWAVGHAIDYARRRVTTGVSTYSYLTGGAQYELQLHGPFHHHPGRIEGEYGNQLARVQEFKEFDDRHKTAGPRKPNGHGGD